MVFNPTAEPTIDIQTATPELLGLIDRCREGNRLAQAELYKKYHGKLMGLCLRYFINRDDALEALNHGFLKIFKNLDAYRPEFAFEAWIYRIVQNTALDYVRSKYKNDWSTDSIQETAEPATEPEVYRQADAAELINLLRRLPAATRTVFNLFAIEGYRHDEIAAMLEISEGTSKWHVNQARLKLKAYLQENESYGK